LEETGGHANRDKAIIKEEQIIDIFSGIGKFLFANVCGNKYLPDSAYPNPFNPITTIGFALPIDSDVSISIYNLQGRISRSAY